jgi:bifunctional UDP-N-acetylglucosamine pyrophosphorylase/glucosamine-1-phosphate N-acetyltransferase
MDPTFLILAAGLGTRMKSKMAKVLHRAGGLALVEHVVRAALGVASPAKIVVVLGHQADRVRVVLERYGVQFAYQAEPRGTGHAVLCCRETVQGDPGPLVVAYGDCPLLTSATFGSLIEQQVRSGKAATLITTRLDDPTGYGRVVLDRFGDVEAIVEQKAATQEQLGIQTINSGIYCFRSDLLWKHISEIQPNAVSGEYYLTDLPEIFARHGHKVGPWHLEDSSQLLGINTRVELAAADRILRERKNTVLMLAGVTIEKPETVIVDPDVGIGNDTIIEASARILGTSRIGSDCRIGACSVISNSEIADSVEIHPFTHIESARVETGASVGPFGRLRPNAHVEGGAHVGNFVELKNTRLGAGSSASHLAYLGDSEIGEHVNIGAGTITCNYDGVKKHRTAIGKNSFIGSNSTLVAPIEIGESAYIAAGSVITDPVPSETLALGRSRQVVKEGWVAKRKARLKAST